MIIYTSVTKYSINSSKNKEQDVFDRLNSMSNQDSDDIGQIYFERESASICRKNLK